MDDKKGVVFYTDSKLDESIARVCREQIKRGFNGEIVSVSLKPLDFGKNIVLEGRVRSYPTMILSIITALEASTKDYVFFCEHDVLYDPSHFKFTPPTDDIYYYNINNWRWGYPGDLAITYDGLHSLSQLCCNRKMALKHFKLRLEIARRTNLDEHRGREPRWARRWGYEPGTKPKKRGGITDETFELWRSEYPNIDIRHGRNFTRSKLTLADFKHPPNMESWREEKVTDIPGWSHIKEMFL